MNIINNKLFYIVFFLFFVFSLLVSADNKEKSLSHVVISDDIASPVITNKEDLKKQLEDLVSYNDMLLSENEILQSELVKLLNKSTSYIKKDSRYKVNINLLQQIIKKEPFNIEEGIFFSYYKQAYNNLLSGNIDRAEFFLNLVIKLLGKIVFLDDAALKQYLLLEEIQVDKLYRFYYKTYYLLANIAKINKDNKSALKYLNKVYNATEKHMSLNLSLFTVVDMLNIYDKSSSANKSNLCGLTRNLKNIIIQYKTLETVNDLDIPTYIEIFNGMNNKYKCNFPNITY